MPIPDIAQPQYIEIEDTLRLRRFDNCFEFAFEWYQNVDTVYLVDGVRRPYDRQTLENMYHYLDRHGELYFIEVWESGKFRPIGDVTFWQEDMPIVIGELQYRGKGIGKKVIAALIERGRQLGYQTLKVGEIYSFNAASRACFESLGFRAMGITEKGAHYELQLR